MIGHYLMTLAAEQEDRVLTTAMRPGSLQGPCLLGVAHNYTEHPESDGLFCRVAGLLGPSMCRESGLLVGWGGPTNPAQRFDGLCARFGVERVTAAIRNRILSNRARRTLQVPEMVVAQRTQPQ